MERVQTLFHHNDCSPAPILLRGVLNGENDGSYVTVSISEPLGRVFTGPKQYL